MKPAVALTTPDDIPPVHVLVAAHDQDRKETEHLLAGFDRPGRGPKLPSPERDFVDYYAKKKGAGGPESGRSAAPHAAASMSSRPPKQADVATIVRPRKQAGAPAWLVWAGAAVLMLGIGGAVAYLATAEAPAGAQLLTGPSAATTITAAHPLPSSDRDVIPPPPPADSTATSAAPITVVEPASTAATDGAPRPGSKRDSRAGAGAHAPSGANATGPGSSGAAATGDTKPPPRDDFIRDL